MIAQAHYEAEGFKHACFGQQINELEEVLEINVA
jgi:hypothetical protein